MPGFLSSARGVFGSKSGSDHDGGSTSPRKSAMPLRLFAAFPVLILAIAFILSFLCVYAGNHKGFMSDYDIFTLNVSRIGDDMLEKLDNGIASIHLDLKKRSTPVDAPVAVVTPVPTTMITRAPRAEARDLGSFLSSAEHHAASDIHSEKSRAGSAISHGESEIHSAATSLATSAINGVNSGLSAVETEVIKAVNHAYHDVIADLNLHDFYSVYMKTNCDGTYVLKDGANITVGEMALPPPNSTHKHIDKCEQHSELDPMSIIRWIYLLGIIFIGISLPVGLWNILAPSKKKTALLIVVSSPSFILILLGSAASHGVAIAATHVINFLGDGLGLAAYEGQKFLTLTWATTVLLLVEICSCGIFLALFSRLNGERSTTSRNEKAREIQLETYRSRH